MRTPHAVASNIDKNTPFARKNWIFLLKNNFKVLMTAHTKLERSP
jgi:hypothetical protein